MNAATQEECGADHETQQLDRLNALLAHSWEFNPFYRSKWERAGVARRPLDCLEDFHAYPFTTRAELLADQSAQPPLGTNLAAPAADFKRILHSSGTTRRPMFWADTTRTWNWVTQCSAALHEITGIKPTDVLLFMGSLGGFSGPWVILEGARRLGCACLTCNGMDVSEAWRWLSLMRPNVLVGRPERLLMLSMAVHTHGKLPKSAGIERIILTGQGSSVGAPARCELERSWEAPCFDRYGLTEGGSVAAECQAHSGALHLLHEEFIAEMVHPSSTELVDEGTVGELVLTNLGRIDRPIIRYRTGDSTWLVRNHHCTCGCEGTLFPRGILDRLD